MRDDPTEAPDGWALIGYSNATGREQTSHLLATVGSQQEADWMFAQVCALADRQRLAVYTEVTGWQYARTVFSVRPIGHPEHAEAVKTITRVLAPGKGLKDRRPALARWGRLNGFTANGGGWVFAKSKPFKPVGQGWDVLNVNEFSAPFLARVVSIGLKYRVVDGPLVTPAEKSRMLVEAAIR